MAILLHHAESLTTEVVKHLKHAIQMGHSGTVTIQELGENVVAVSQSVLGIGHFVGEVLQKLSLNVRQRF